MSRHPSVSSNHGRIRSLGFGPAVRIVALKGSYVFTFPPPAIGEGTAPFSATFVIPQDSWEGRGSFSYGSKEVEDVPVTLVAE